MDSVNDALAVDRTALTTLIDGVVKNGEAAPPPDATLPFTTRSQRVIELSMAVREETLRLLG